ncbi:MAG: hypothetical protein ACREER_04775 [Alphaproteobacteria bacterium]
MSLNSVGVLPAGVRLGTSEAREAGLTFGGPADGGVSQQAAGTFGFADLLDIVNPLQHLPVIGMLYREWTGDEISGPARILGDTLFGGPLGLIVGVIESIIESTTGETVGAHLYAAAFGGDEPAPPPPVALASAAPEPEHQSVHQSVHQSMARPEPRPAASAAIEVQPTVPPGVPAITGYQAALDAMGQALDRYEATPTGELYDESF